VKKAQMSMPLAVTKGHGTGNDFVLFADPDGALELTGDQYRFLADRHRGLGADGIIRAVHTVASPEVAHLLEQEPAAQWFMDYRNADGSLAEMCGNGVRVFCRIPAGTAIGCPGGGEHVSDYDSSGHCGCHTQCAWHLSSGYGAVAF